MRDDGTSVRRVFDEAGFRYTPQRAGVYVHLCGVDNHPTAEQVFQAVRQRLPRISLATVYNALEALVEAGLANKLTNGDGAARYDCRSEPHYHLRDLNNDAVRDLPTRYDPALLDKLDPQLVEKLAAAGFRVTGYRLEVVGYFER